MPRKHLLLIFLSATISMAGFLLASHFTYRMGFPLDDAWIHQTYARNLAELGEWSFIPGKPSAGSTAPLWSGLLTIGHMVGLGPYAWTYWLGWVGLVGLGAVGYFAVGVLVPDQSQWRIWGAVLLIFEWHLVWAGGSGMETLLFAGMVTLVLLWIAAGGGYWFWLGMMIGLCAWVRPDGVTLLAPAGIGILIMRGGESGDWRMRSRALVTTLFGFLLLFLPYLGFNWSLSGTWWPNTFFAKQAEYAVLQEAFIGWRFLEQLSLPLIGVGIVLLPGVVMLFGGAWEKRQWNVLLGMVWWLGYVGLYAWRLPVTYQHGRYLMPAMPIFFLWGLAGMAVWMKGQRRGLVHRVVKRAWVIIVGAVLGIFWLQGARAYALDVAFIESEMVETARWVTGNTQKDDLIAAHDIGALGYFGERDLVDLAGLVSPEVIPFIRDEAQLMVFLEEEHADYLITLRGWYPMLEEGKPILFETSGEFARRLGGTNMVVYGWVKTP